MYFITYVGSVVLDHPSTISRQHYLLQNQPVHTLSHLQVSGDRNPPFCLGESFHLIPVDHPLPSSSQSCLINSLSFSVIVPLKSVQFSINMLLTHVPLKLLLFIHCTRIWELTTCQHSSFLYSPLEECLHSQYLLLHFNHFSTHQWPPPCHIPWKVIDPLQSGQHHGSLLLDTLLYLMMLILWTSSSASPLGPCLFQWKSS